MVFLPSAWRHRECRFLGDKVPQQTPKTVHWKSRSMLDSVSFLQGVICTENLIVLKFQITKQSKRMCSCTHPAALWIGLWPREHRKRGRSPSPLSACYSLCTSSHPLLPPHIRDHPHQAPAHLHVWEWTCRGQQRSQGKYRKHHFLKKMFPYMISLLL